MRRALISDVHANLDALREVLNDIRSQGITEVYCLGDVIGYGPNPVECLDEVRRVCKVTILGNHDQAALFDPDGFNPVALAAVYWTRDQLENAPGNQAMINRRWDWLGELPRMHSDNGLTFVHGSPREPTNEYVFPEDVYNQRKMDALFGRIEKYCFQGHTHIPGVFTQSGEFITPEDCNNVFRLTSDKIMVNVGSVGQPRDGNPKSCYVIVTDDALFFRRVEYPVDETANKIYAIPELDNSLGDRLKAGR